MWSEYKNETKIGKNERKCAEKWDVWKGNEFNKKNINKVIGGLRKDK